jgi:peptidylprolyl isomerase
VAAEIERARQSVVAETYLQSVSAAPQDYPSEAELQEAYDKNKTAFLVPRSYRLAQIFVAAQKGAAKDVAEQARTKLDASLKKLKKGADFAAVAATDSEDPQSAGQGGEIGWLYENDIKPEIKAAVSGLPKDGLSEPIPLDDGWHVVKLLDTKAASTRPLSEVRDQLAKQLRAERSYVNGRAYLAHLLEETPPAINELALSKVLTPAAASSAGQ